MYNPAKKIKEFYNKYKWLYGELMVKEVSLTILLFLAVWFLYFSQCDRY